MLVLMAGWKTCNILYQAYTYLVFVLCFSFLITIIIIILFYNTMLVVFFVFDKWSFWLPKKVATHKNDCSTVKINKNLDEKCIWKRNKYNKIINYLMLLFFFLCTAPLREQYKKFIFFLCSKSRNVKKKEKEKFASNS